MQFQTQLIQGKLIKRYKRFLADVTLDNGEMVTAHCPNTGAMTGCAEPGWQVWLSPSNNPKRKLPYTWEVVLTDEKHWIGINTHRANQLVEEAICQRVITELQDYQTLQREVMFGEENSRIDFLLTDPNKKNCYVEVKSVTLMDKGLGYFPDAKTARGQKHLRELTLIAEQGKRAVLLFCVQHSGIQSVQVAKSIDPDYASALHKAMQSGVEILCYGCELNAEKIDINQSLPFFSEN